MTDYTTCFVAIAPSGSAHYRASLPAFLLGAGLLVRSTTLELVKDTEPLEADCYVYHLPTYDWQLEEIVNRRREGAKVLLDVDDYLWAIPTKDDHATAASFTEERLRNHQASIVECDGVIVSTPQLGELLSRRHQANVLGVAPNGLDLPRFQGGGEVQAIKDPSSIVIGWSGSTGHLRALESIMDAVNAAMELFPRATFLSIGEPAAMLIEHEGRRQHVGWLPMSHHAAYLRSFDVNLAPALDDEFYRCKSPLRFYEAAAAGSVFLGSPVTYGDVVQHEKTGFLYRDEDDFYALLQRILADKKLRKRVGREAEKWATYHAGADAPEIYAAWKGAIDRGMGLA